MHLVTKEGLQLGVAGGELGGWRGEPERANRLGRSLLGLPAVLLLVFLLVPMVWTTIEALVAPTPVVGNFRDILTDSGALAAAGHSLLWVGIALLLIGIGYGIAVISRLIRNWRGLLCVLIPPLWGSRPGSR